MAITFVASTKTDFDRARDCIERLQEQFDERLRGKLQTARDLLTEVENEAAGHDPVTAGARAALVVDLHRTTVTLDGRQVHLTPKRFELLAALAADPSRCFHHEDLLCDIWGLDFDEARHTTNTLKSHASLIRDALDHDHRFIVSVYGRGYRLVEPGHEGLVEFVPIGGPR